MVFKTDPVIAPVIDPRISSFNAINALSQFNSRYLLNLSAHAYRTRDDRIFPDLLAHKPAARGFRETQLWTVKGLDAARRLYEHHGFVLAEEYEGDQWGNRVIEHKFVRPLAAG